MSLLYRDRIFNNQWILIIFIDRDVDHEKIQNYYSTTIQSIRKEIMVKIYIYYHPTVISATKLIFGLDTKLISTNLTALDLLAQSVQTNQSIIFITNFYFYINPSDAKFFQSFISGLDKNIYALSDFFNDSQYQLVSKKFQIDKFIDYSVLIIPASRKNMDYIISAHNISTKLNTSDPQFKCRVSLTIASIKNPDLVKNIETFNKDGYFFDIKHPNAENILNEYNIIHQTPLCQSVKKLLFDYRNPNYIFYPYLDINCINKKNITDKCHLYAFNTLGIQLNIDENIYPLMYKRFSTPNHGIFIKKIDTNIVIPQIIHHIFLDNSDADHINFWKESIQSTWIQKIWTNENIIDVISDNKWTNLYIKSDGLKKNIVLIFAILEKYGGLIINKNIYPIKNIPKNLLISKLICFFDGNNCEKLTYDIIGSVPGKNTEQQPKITNNGWQPHEGRFFREEKMIREKKLNKKLENQNVIICPELFDKIYAILSNIDILSLRMLDSMLINYPDVTIYPNYYINITDVPRGISDMAFGETLPDVNMETMIEINKIVPPKRSQSITKETVSAILSENPRDRLKNHRII